VEVAGHPLVDFDFADTSVQARSRRIPSALRASVDWIRAARRGTPAARPPSVSDGQYWLATLAWQAFREPTPEPLDDLRRRDSSALPFLAAAVERFLPESEPDN
jgi:hypothetical protein